MKKKIQALVGGLALAAIVGVNGYIAIDGSETETQLSLENVENVAEGFEIFGYAFNERERYFDQRTVYYNGKYWTLHGCVEGEKKYIPFQECQIGELYALAEDGEYHDMSGMNQYW